MGNNMSPKDLHQSTLDQEVPASMSEKQDSAYWRHASEHEGTVAVDQEKHQEFDAQNPDQLDPAGRRNFMKVMGASMMLGSLASCARQPEEKIVPYVKPPEERIPGRPDYYATAVSLAGFGMGAVATSYDGRPTKIEGLSEHPASLGATGIHSQSTVLDLYSPDRVESISRAGSMATWNQFVADIARAMVEIDTAAGAGLTVLTETVTSPTIQGQMAQLQALFPEMRWREHDPMGRNNTRQGAMQAFGQYAEANIDFTKAKTILSLDANFLHEGPAHVRYAHDFAITRSAEANADAADYQEREHFNRDEMSRLYVAECTPTLTGASADHLVSVSYPNLETLARVVAERVGVAGVSANAESASHLDSAWIDALVDDLTHSKGHAVVVAGDAQPPVVHALAHAINDALAAVESGLISYIDSPEADATDQQKSLGKLVDDLNNDQVKLLVILGGNPVYNTPGTIDLATAFDKVPLRVHLTGEANETSPHCHWVIPESHALESWGDIRAYDGTHSIVQPLIKPLYNGKTASQILAVLLGTESASDYDLVRARFKGLYGAASDRKWKVALSKGIVDGTAFPAKSLKAHANFPAEATHALPDGLELLFRIDPTVGDGRHANNGWLQELPKPLTKLTWDNALHINPATAKKRELEQEDVVIIKVGEREVRAAVMLMFGHPKGSATLHLGYGRSVAGYIGKDRGFNAYTLQDADSPWYLNSGATLAKTGRNYLLSRTEEHNNIEQSLQVQAQKATDRHLIRSSSLSNYNEHPDFAKHMGHHAPERENTLYDPDEKDYAGLSWGMTIDLNRCTGCNVCTIACQAENNIPIVGKDDVSRGREMHWIRVDRYYKGDMSGEGIQTTHQPVPCMQCENAPCEPVCPVGGTMHSKEGLNDMIYNRCVGTRYCANNCPYKVRRFNFFHYQIREGQDAPQLKMMRNPNVTVRSRGVMEKCTFCVQRINRARIDAKVAAAQNGSDEVSIADGTLVTACQAACPSQAIDFGNINDPESRVSLRKQNPRDYGLLADIGTRPRTTYLAKLSNPSSKMAGPDAGAEAHTAEH
jgi:Fe-S-cluster-containing dehydrogenase component/anaerobic selenocysteine-containing dehydrogenase